VARLARAAEATFDYAAVAQPVLDEMRSRTGETAQFQRRINDAAVCVAVSESDHAIRLSFQPGHPMPLHSGAAAKVLMASLPDARRTAYLDRLRPALSKSARAGLEKDLRRIRDTGYAESEGEVDEGVWAVAMPVRVDGGVVGAVTVAAPSYRLTAERKRAVVEAVRDGSVELSAALSARW
jgi:DNA-binding IclR family transcriptional regulator